MNSDKRLLIIEDDNLTRKLLQTVFTDSGFLAKTVTDASSALTELQQNGLPHIILLDLGLPGMDGMTLGERIKRMGDVPIVILSGEQDEEARVQSIGSFADDFITKPFNVQEVVVRVQRVLSRVPNYEYAQGPSITIDSHLAIDFTNNRVWLDGSEVALTPTETALLHILMRNKGHIVSSDTLLARVWPNEEVYEETLRVHMHRLRRKLQMEKDAKEYIHTERGLGYAFVTAEGD